MTMAGRIRNWVDKHLNKFISRKLFVFIVGTCLLCFGLINGEIWVTLASFYLTWEGAKDVVVAHNESKQLPTSISTSTSVTATTTPVTDSTNETVENTITVEDGNYDRKG